MCRTPARVSSTMIQIANRNTAATMVVSPKPNRIISTGTSADSGALEKMLTHMPSRSSAIFTRPIRMPSGTPTTIDSDHADDEGAQRGDRRALPGRRLHESTAARQHLAEGRQQEDQVEPADDLPEHAPDEQRGHHRHAVAEQGHAQRLTPHIASAPARSPRPYRDSACRGGCGPDRRSGRSRAR